MIRHRAPKCRNAVPVGARAAHFAVPIAARTSQEMAWVIRWGRRLADWDCFGRIVTRIQQPTGRVPRRAVTPGPEPSHRRLCLATAAFGHIRHQVEAFRRTTQHLKDREHHRTLHLATPGDPKCCKITQTSACKRTDDRETYIIFLPGITVKSKNLGELIY